MGSEMCIRDRIDRVNDSVTEILQSVTLHDLEKEYQEYIDYGQDMYYI